MINLAKVTNRLKVIGFMIGAAALTACTSTGYYWGSNATYGIGAADFYYVGSGYNGWDRTNYYDYGWGQYRHNRLGWGGYYDRAGYYPAYYYRHGYHRTGR